MERWRRRTPEGEQQRDRRTRHRAMISSPPTCGSGTSRSKARSARARPRSQSDWHTPRCDARTRIVRTRSSRTSTAIVQAQRCRHNFYLLSRHRQQTTLQQADLFSQTTVADYLFDKDKIFAYLNLDDNELFIYQRLYDLLSRDVPAPDLVIYLQAPTDVLLRRARTRRDDPEIEAFEPIRIT